VKRRSQIELTEEERRSYVAAAPTMVLCSNGTRGYPHAVAMWFVVDADDTVWMTTYRKSQKALNIRRDPKVALHVESGVTYDQLKGVLIRGDAELIDDEDVCVQTIRRIQEKMTGSLLDGVEDAMRAQARKRVAIKVTPRRVSSWDHSKLGGVY
jgi:PPOX class probable F420-dependent enzyme